MTSRYKQHTKESVSNILKTNNSKLILIEEFCGTTIKHKFMCDKGHITEKRLNRALQGSECNVCRLERNCISGTIQQRKTKEYIINQLSNLRSKSVELIGDYVNSNTLATFRCNICNYTWISKPKQVLDSFGCVACSKIASKISQRLSQEEYSNRVKTYSNNIIVIDQYIDNKTIIKHKCLTCNTIFNRRPSSLTITSNIDIFIFLLDEDHFIPQNFRCVNFY